MLGGRRGLVLEEGVGQFFPACPREPDSANSQAAELNASRQVSVHGKRPPSLSRLPVCLHTQ